VRLTAKPPITVDCGHKCNSFIQVRYSANFLELALENKDVGKVYGFAQGDGRYENVNKAKGV
jgi:hypothetical protein